MRKRLKLTAKAEMREYRKHKQGNGDEPSADEPSLLSKRIEELLPLEFTAERSLFTSTPLVSNKNKW